MGAITAALVVSAAGLTLGYEYWRAKPEYGRDRGLPPGSLGLVTSLRALFQERFYFDESARHGPVFKFSQFHRPVVCLMGLERGARLLSTHEDSLTAPSLPFNRAIPRGFLRYMEAADHGRYAPLFRTALSADLVRTYEPRFEECMRRELARMTADSERAASEGAAGPRRGVALDPYLGRAVFAALAEVFYGIAPDTTAFAQLETVYRGFDPRHFAPGAHRRNVRRIEDLVRLLRAAPGAGPAQASSFARNLAAIRPDALDDPTVAGNLTFMFDIARDNVTGLLRWVMKHVAEHPERLAAVRALQSDAGDGAGAREAARQIVNETLRLEQSEYIYRIARRDLEFEGFTIPRGWMIRICVRESHRDPAVFASPDAFDPGRFAGAQPPKTEYSPFGMGRHGCFGAQLSVAMARALVIELARGYDVSIAADGRRARRRWRHWAHWTPSPRLRVVLRPHGRALDS